MPKRVVTLCLAAMLTTVLAFAQGPRNGGGSPPDAATMIKMRVEFLANRLNLTEAQKTQATAIFTDAHTASETLRTNMQTARQSLLAAVKKNDTAAIDQLAVTIGALTGQLTAIESKAEAAFYSILTADQQAQYDNTRRSPVGGMRMGPGGFGPRPEGGPQPR